MSVRCRYWSRRRRWPTRINRPRRLWWSCLCSLRCSVRSLMRCVSIATWTSGEPVSASPVAYSDMIFCFVAASSGTLLLRCSLRGAPGPTSPGLYRSAAVLTASVRVPARLPTQRIAGEGSGVGGAGGFGDAEHLVGPGDVGGHLLDQCLDAVEPQRRSQPLDELDGDALAVEVQVVPVEHVGLDPPLRAVERRVRADRDRRRQNGVRRARHQGRADQPARVDAVRGDLPDGVLREVRGGVAELAPAVVAVDGDADDPGRPAK